jgi:hypothetical protein
MSCTQITLPTRFLTTTAHFIAVVTILFDVVRLGYRAAAVYFSGRRWRPG